MRVAIVANNTFEYDSRLRRAGMALAGDGHDVVLVGLAGPGLPPRETLPMGIPLLRLNLDRRITTALRPLPDWGRRGVARLLGIDPEAEWLPPMRPTGPDRLRAPFRRLLEIVAHLRRVASWTDALVAAVPGADVYHAKALVALPVVHAAAKRSQARFVYDVADLHSESERLARMPRVVRAAVRARERRWAREAAALTAVSDAVADELVRWFGVERPVVVMNCPPAWRPDEPAPPVSERLRLATGLPADRPVILYQGGLSIDRGIEELVAALDERPLAELAAAVVLLGYGRLRDPLRRVAERRLGRLFVLDAVPQSELLEWTASADLTYVGQPPRTLNWRLNLPNKLFESLMAGVPVLVGERTEHCRLMSAESVGRCCDVESPAAIARTAAEMLQASPRERAALRARCRAIALERYSWERQQQGLVELYRRLAAAP